MSNKTLMSFIGKSNKIVRLFQKMIGIKPEEEELSEVEMLALVNRYIENNISMQTLNRVRAYENSTAPTTEMHGSSLLFFANGTPITIESNGDPSDGALITWGDGESMEVPATTTVIGGYHDNDILVNTSITMHGGCVRGLIGGGLHKSHTVSAKIVMDGGIVSNGIMGGGAASYTKNCKCTWYAGDPKESPCITDATELHLTGGECRYVTYGGGEGISYTGKVDMLVGGDFATYYLTAGGSNGYTGESNVIFNGDAFAVVMQGVNRGMVEKIYVTITDGNIQKYFVGGEVPFAGTVEKPNGNDASGSFKDAQVVISHNAKVEAFKYGGNNYTEIADPADVEGIKVSVKFK